MGFFFGRGKGKGIPKNATFRITQEGREKLQEFNGDPKSQILMSLETRGTSDIKEIADGSGLSKGQVERYIKPLTSGGYIQYVSSSAGDEVE